MSARAKVIGASIGAAAVLLSAAIAGGWWFYWPVHQVETQVRARLNDPESARFSGVTFNRTKSVGCGLVNAKNRMGGYVGDTYFIIFPDGDLRFEPAEPSSSGDVEKLAALKEQLNFRTLMSSNCAFG